MVGAAGQTDPTSALPRVLAHIVTFNHQNTVSGAIDALLGQQGFVVGENLEILLTDNASTDSTPTLLQRYAQPGVAVQCNNQNLGFSGAHNVGATRAVAEQVKYLFVLNPDIALEADALARLVEALERDPSAGAACPKLLRASDDLKPVTPVRLDAAGMYITPALRHLDRGSEELDCGQFDADEYVFGGSGAALLLRVETIRDVALSETATSGVVQLFDDAFFAYREDADLAWRMQWRGWATRYVATARGAHVRHVLPERRGALSPLLNRLGVRNRFLLQFNNLSLSLACALFPRWIVRNILVLAAVCLRERTSLPGVREAWTLRIRARKNRRETIGKARVSTAALRRWFGTTPVTFPALNRSARTRVVGSVNIVIVNYNSGDRLERALKALRSAVVAATPRVVVTVVDNASLDTSASRLVTVKEPTVDILSGALPVRIIFSEQNLGFAGGVNRGAREQDADAVMIMNPDLELRSETLGALIEALERYPQLGMVSPVLVGKDGRVQHGFTARRFPSLASTLAELFFLHRIWPRNPWTMAYRLQDDRPLRAYLERETTPLPHHDLAAPVVVDQPAGACLLVRTETFRRLDGFDERFWPAWFEDVDFALRARRIGALAAVVGGSRADHEGGYSLSYLSASGFSEAWYSNLIRYWRKSGSTGEYLTLRALLPIALLLRSAATYFESIKLGLGERPEEAKNKRGHALTLFRLSLRRER